MIFGKQVRQIEIANIMEHLPLIDRQNPTFVRKHLPRHSLNSNDNSANKVKFNK